jgi:glucose/arabinose dehydrogenase
VVLACGSLSAPAGAVPTALTLNLQPVISGLRSPVDIRTAGDGSGRLFIVEKRGTIQVAHGGQLLEPPFLDLRPIVGSSGTEQGLLGLAFHPRYRDNGLFFVNYTDTNGDTVVARYQVSADPDVADPGTGAVILFQDQPYANHNGGNLVFGPDGYLWIGLGDGGSGGDPQRNGQNGATWLGKLLRIDVDGGFPYVVPPDNPFVGWPGSLPESWAMGLRNPWRYTFDRLTGDLWIGDVGQNTWEEVDFVPAGSSGGLNFGWNVAEGNHCFRGSTCDLSPFVAPVAEYLTGAEGCAVVGGYVYRGAAYPAMYGTYLYADECSGRVWSLTRDEAGNWRNVELLRARVNISSFGEDEAGELYVAGYGDGTIYRVTAE